MKILIHLILFLNISLSVYSQNGCDPIYDSIRVNDDIILSTSGSNATILKINTLGNELWQIDVSGFSKIHLYHSSDLFIYASLRNEASNFNRILKLNVNDGSIVWQSDITNSDGYIQKLKDYKSNQLFFYHLISTGSGWTTRFKVFLIDKANGFITEEYELNEPIPSPVVIDIDSKGNLIYSRKKYNKIWNINIASLVKVNGINIYQIIWEKTYNDPSTGETPNDGYMGFYIFIDRLDNIYAFDRRDNVNLYKIDSDTGNIIWSIDNISNETFISDYKILNNELYVSYQHRYVGSGNYYFSISKINTTIGNTIWTTNEDMSIIGNQTSSSGHHEAIQSFQLDCNGDVFATGYYEASNYSPGAWGIMKINGQNGSKISDITITQDINLIDSESVGKFTYFINGELVYLGNLEYETYSSSKYLLKTDANLAITHQNGFDCVTLTTTEFAENDNKINVYPNPSNDFIYINSQDSLIIKSINLFSVNGIEIKRWKENQSKISIKNLSSGVYFLEIVLSDNSKSSKR